MNKPVAILLMLSALSITSVAQGYPHVRMSKQERAAVKQQKKQQKAMQKYVKSQEKAQKKALKKSYKAAKKPNKYPKPF